MEELQSVLAAFSQGRWLVTASADGVITELTHRGNLYKPGVLLRIVRLSQVRQNGDKAPRFAFEEYRAKRVAQLPKDEFYDPDGRVKPFESMGPVSLANLLQCYWNEYKNGG